MATMASRGMDKYIKAGDLVIVYMTRDRTPLPLTVTPGEELINSFGAFAHADMVGRPFGSKMTSRNRRGFLHLLRPTPELWTLALPHRTQILYQPDMSFITLRLGLGPGARVIEAGTGSGSFSHVLARTVGRVRTGSGEGQGQRVWKGEGNSNRDARDAGGRSRGKKSKAERNAEKQAKAEAAAAAGTTPTDAVASTSTENILDATPAASTSAENGICASDLGSAGEAMPVEPELDANLVPEGEGRVWSFEFHSERVERARSEFAAHGLSGVVRLAHRNVCRDGFGLEDVADAVFLDLPAPWEAIPHAAQALRADITGRICCFSPCIEQVLRTVTALNESGFSDITTFEALTRTYDLNTQTGPLPSIDTAIERIKNVEVRKEERRRQQIEDAKKERQRRAVERAAAAAAKRKREEGAEEERGEGAMGIEEDAEREEEATPNESESAQRNEAEVAPVKRIKTGDDTDTQPAADLVALLSSSEDAMPGIQSEGSSNAPTPGTAAPASMYDSAPAAALTATASSSSSSLKSIFGAASTSASTSTTAQGNGKADRRESRQNADAKRKLPIGHSGARLLPRPIELSNVYAKPFDEMRGHTSYLTFASLLPRVVPGLGVDDGSGNRTGNGTGNDNVANAKAGAGADVGFGDGDGDENTIINAEPDQQPPTSMFNQGSLSGPCHQSLRS